MLHAIMPTRRIHHALVALLAALTLLWLLAEPKPWPQPLTWFSFRAVFVQYSGVIAIGAMSVAMLLALRPRRLEPHLDGLDKMYRLHKWLGIAALSTSVLHWWFAKGTKWMVGWGWLERPVRGPRPAGDQRGYIEALLGSQRGLAETVGEWVFYAAAILMILALVKRFPYHLFARTHKWLAATYLALVFHSVVLVKFSYWTQPVGLILALLMAGGTVAAALVLAGRVGARRKVRGTVIETKRYPGVDSLETVIEMAPGWPGHAAGQFAFVTVDVKDGAKDGAHPYTIASAWDAQSPRLSFITKALGDHTRALPELLRPGREVTVEGPYGRFDFEDGRERQIWVGAGIGITPFVARMQQLARRGGPRAQIDLFHATAQRDEAALARLRADAAAAGIRLHVLVDAEDGLLDGERIRRLVPDWAQASLWFCGPGGFGRALHADFAAQGLPARAFHQELFQMR